MKLSIYAILLAFGISSLTYADLDSGEWVYLNQSPLDSVERVLGCRPSKFGSLVVEDTFEASSGEDYTTISYVNFQDSKSNECKHEEKISLKTKTLNDLAENIFDKDDQIIDDNKEAKYIQAGWNEEEVSGFKRHQLIRSKSSTHVVLVESIRNSWGSFKSGDSCKITQNDKIKILGFHDDEDRALVQLQTGNPDEVLACPHSSKFFLSIDHLKLMSDHVVNTSRDNDHSSIKTKSHLDTYREFKNSRKASNSNSK